MVCRHCGADLDAPLDDVECRISCPNTSPCNPCKELASLEIFIARLEKKRAELKRTINRAHSPFIRTIPPEIIARISGFANTDFTIIGSLPAPILLSSICSDWRRTVVGTPQLWSSIKIDLPDNMASSKLLRLATFIDKWLARSGQLPLHISLSSGSQNLESRATLPTLFMILDQYSFRWHSLNISTPPTLLSYLQPDRLPLLEQLNINVEPAFAQNVVLNLPSSPRLKAIGITNISLSDIGIQWDNVTHISTEKLDLSYCLKLLRLIPHLVHCSFHNITDENRLPEPPTLSPLSYLSLSYYQRQRSDRFLNKIVLPSLGTLILFNISSMGPLMAFLKRSACSLHTLSLHDLHLDNFDSLMEVLQFLSPSLTKLVISRPPKQSKDLEEYLSILTKTYSSQNAVAENGFLPHLEIFEYREAFPRSINSLNLPARKSTRRISLCSAYIHLITVHPPPVISQDVLSILSHLNEDGILNISGTLRNA